jgi:hypothetical protein
MADPNPLPVLDEAQRAPLVELLLGRIEQLLEEQRRQAELIQQSRDKIAVLKGEKARPKFKPRVGWSRRPSPRPPTATPATERADRPNDRDRRNVAKPRSSSSPRPSGPPGVELPAGSRFKGYRDFVVQDLRIAAHNTRG